jgi:peptidyl-prolyl cis-trans isomerase C
MRRHRVLVAAFTIAAGAGVVALALHQATQPPPLDPQVTAALTPLERQVAALKAAQPGQVVGPIAVEGGWAIVRVDEKRPEQPIAIEAARPQIVRFLTYGQVRDLLEKLRGGAKVENLLPRGPALPGAPSEPAAAPTGPPALPPPSAEGPPSQDQTLQGQTPGAPAASPPAKTPGSPKP